MARKHTRRRVWIPLPPKGLRPRLDASQQTDLALCHIMLLDDIAQGRGTEQTLWDFCAAVFTWCKAAEAANHPDHLPCMAAQLELATRVVERYGATGRVGFSGPEYQLAKRGIDAMDALAETTDRITAMAAAEWSEGVINRLAAGVHPGRLLRGMCGELVRLDRLS
jgi:hypothetical protein